MSASIKDIEARIEETVEGALQAFWAAVVEKFPEVTTGDYDPMLEGIMYAEAEEWVAGWLRMNATERIANEDKIFLEEVGD